jgi:hypothetical protein
MKAKPQES